MEPQSSPSESMQSLPVSIASDAEKNENFKITLDSPNNTYYSGQTIRGTIELTNKQAKKIRGESSWVQSIFKQSAAGRRSCTSSNWMQFNQSECLISFNCFDYWINVNGILSSFLSPFRRAGIYFRIVGYGKCSWTDILRRDPINDGVKSERTPIQQHSGNEKYLNSTVHVIGAKNGAFRPSQIHFQQQQKSKCLKNRLWSAGPSFCLSEGTSTYDFSFQLKRKLPSSFAGTYGKIKYKMEFVIDKPWKFDEKQQIVLTIIQLVDVHSTGALLPIVEGTSRVFGYIGSGPIALQVLIPKNFYVPSETLPIQVIVTNNSRINVDKMKFALHKIVTYHSSMPNRVRKLEVQKILKKEAGGVAKKTEQRYQHEIEIPAATPSQNDEVSVLIHIQYELIVEAKVGGLYKNLVLSLPLTIGNVPACGSLAMPLPTTSLPVAVPYGPPYSSSRAAGETSSAAIPLGFNFNRLSITSNSSIRLIPSTSPGSNCSAGPLDRMIISHLTDTDSITSASPSSSLSRTNNSFSSHSRRSTSMTTAPTSVSSIQPSAPPLDSSPMNTSHTSHMSHTTTSTHTSVCLDAPPSYDEVFGTASTSQSYTEVHSSSPNCPNARKT